MKKIMTVLLTSLLLLTACGSNNIMKDYKKLDKKDHHFKSLGVSETLDALEEKQEGIYFIGYAGCQFCSDFVPILEDVLTEIDQTAIYLDIQDKAFNQEAVERFLEFDKSLPENKQSKGGVPFLVVINDKGDVNTFAGTVQGHNPGVEELSENQIEYLKIKLKQTIQFND